MRRLLRQQILARNARRRTNIAQRPTTPLAVKEEVEEKGGGLFDQLVSLARDITPDFLESAAGDALRTIDAPRRFVQREALTPVLRGARDIEQSLGLDKFELFGRSPVDAAELGALGPILGGVGLSDARDQVARGEEPTGVPGFVLNTVTDPLSLIGGPTAAGARTLGLRAAAAGATRGGTAPSKRPPLPPSQPRSRRAWAAPDASRGFDD
jgi:hypothetical protein